MKSLKRRCIKYNFCSDTNTLDYSSVRKRQEQRKNIYPTQNRQVINKLSD